jgi:hypothetical protein
MKNNMIIESICILGIKYESDDAIFSTPNKSSIYIHINIHTSGLKNINTLYMSNMLPTEYIT